VRYRIACRWCLAAVTLLAAGFAWKAHASGFVLAPLVIAALVVLVTSFGRGTQSHRIAEISALLSEARRSDDAVAPVAALITPWFIVLPESSTRRWIFGRHGLLFRDEVDAETWKALVTQLRLQRLVKTK